MLKKISLIGLVFNMFVTSSVAAEEARIYVIPGDAHCVLKKESRKTYCTDSAGAPITGKLNRYKDNILLRSYELADGYLNGVSVNYDTKGRETAKKTYVDGTLNGVSQEFYPSGVVENEIEYVNGKKEGSAKFYDEAGNLSVQAMYQNNGLNGKMQIYSAKKQLLYNLQNVNNKYVSGTYYYLDANGEDAAAEIPQIIINALNHKCLEFQSEKTTSACSAVFNPENTDCDEKWRQNNRTAVRQYLAACLKGAINE